MRFEPELQNGSCANDLAFAVLTGLIIPMAPLLIHRSHDHRPHAPGLRVDYELALTDARGVELSRGAVRVEVAIEEQQAGCRWEPLLDLPHPEALELAFDAGVATLLARLVGDEATLARLRDAAR